MNYTQFHQEFDRIYKLLEKSLPQKFSWEDENGTENKIDFSLLEDEWESYDIFEKINILATIFTAKNEKGGWVLKEGNKQNSWNQRYSQIIQGLKIAEGINDTKIPYWRGKKETFPHTIRDLFLANCIPSNDPRQDKIKIENLKLILQNKKTKL